MTIGAVKGLIKRPTVISPAGLHFKSNPLKAFYNANRYKPNSNALNDFVSIEHDKNPELAEQILPYKSVIGNYAKSIGKRLTVKFHKAKFDQSKEKVDLLSLSYLTVNKKGQNTCPAGVAVSNFSQKGETRKPFEQVVDRILEVLPAQPGHESFKITSKLDKVQIAPKNN